jgi:hypothetical protein
LRLVHDLGISLNSGVRQNNVHAKARHLQEPHCGTDIGFGRRCVRPETIFPAQTRHSFDDRHQSASTEG